MGQDHRGRLRLQGRPVKLKEIADRIDAHLKRFEKDPAINKLIATRKMKLRTYWLPSAVVAGNRVFVRYVSYQGQTSLTKAEAERYLIWLDEGNTGPHWAILASNWTLPTPAT